MTDNKVRYGGDEWLKALQQNLAKLLGEGRAEMEGASVRILEIIADAPAEMADPVRSDGSLAWHIVIDGQHAYAGRGEIQDADFCLVADYNSILTLARWVYAGDGSDEAAIEAHRQELQRAGMYRSSGELPSSTPALGALLGELHNSMARITA